MEISPISGIRALPVLKPRSNEAELAFLPDVQESARMDDETYTPSDEEQESAAGAEPEEEFTDAPDGDEREQQDAPAIQPGAERAISFFA
jgi:hypothetical protein